MAKVLGFDPQNKIINELEQKVKLQEQLIAELIKLNEAYEVEVKRLVEEYDSLHRRYSIVHSPQTISYTTVKNNLTL